mmetsp:Transcript_33877/g.86603  ORF Transcript_33877/g.86603 Transcript_33877/m.86603 type:complete len:378 (+) Transcript_33877:1-1134(+)
MGYLFAASAAAAARLERSPPGEQAAKEDAAAALALLDGAIIKSGRMEEGSSRWEFPYLRAVVGTLIDIALGALRTGSGAATQPPPGCAPALLRIPAAPPPHGRPLPSAPRAVPVRERSALSLPDFLNEHLNAREPVVIRGYLDDSSWPALRRWPDLAYWLEAHGQRTVPVECQLEGGPGTELREMTMRAFICEYMVPSNASHGEQEHGYERRPRTAEAAAPDDGAHRGPVGYISQHGMFHQLRETQDDFSVPIYARGAGRLAMVNAWMGTRGTVTHLHTDEHDNLLAQVAGVKYLRLAAPENREALTASPHPRATPGNPLNWFSPVDAEAPDAAHPAAGGVAWREVTLGPGDLLFIPRGWWHYVRALSTSISVNFWF